MDANTPEQLASDIANTIDSVAKEPAIFEKLSQGAYARAQEIGNFDLKLNWLLDTYSALIKEHRDARNKEAS